MAKEGSRFSVRCFCDSPLLCFFLMLAYAIPVLFTGLGAPAFMDHEGRYAEVAREMLLTGDWITPHLNFTVFLNKPPLPYWLTALTFLLTGPSEYARFWQALTGLLLIMVTVLLGKTLVGWRTGVLAGLVLLTSGGFFLESRLLRPDLLLTLFLSVALLGFLKASKRELGPDVFCGFGSVSDRWLLLSGASLGAAVMTKGMVGGVLVGGILGGLLMSEGRLAVLRQFHWLPAFTAMLLLILPWHVLAGLQNQGFWWDYIVNQHLLFFFDKKFPRDSIPDSLLVFWGAFFGRMFPWSACLPLALVWAGKRIWMDRSVAVVLPLIWLGIVLGFFTFSPSRLEHYTLPALPAAALVLGCWWSEVLVQPSRYVRSLGVAIAILGAIGLLGLLTAPTLLASETWAREFPILPTLAQWVCGASLTAAGMAGICLWHNSFRGVFIAIAGVSLPLFLNTYLALLAIEPINSWKLVGRRLMEVLPPDGEAIFAASDEYQICGGLNFYSHKPLSIVLPNGYIPPTYLDLDHHGPFLTQRDFLKRWQSDQPVVVIVDPDRPGLYTTSLVPPPVIEIDHWGERVMIANRAFAKRQVLMADSIHD